MKDHRKKKTNKFIVRKSFIGCFVAVIIFILHITPVYAVKTSFSSSNVNEVKVFVNGYSVNFSERPIFDNGILFLEAEAIIKTLGYKYENGAIYHRNSVYEIKEPFISNNKVFISAPELLEIQNNVLWAAIKIEVTNINIDVLVNKYRVIWDDTILPKFAEGELLLPLEPILTMLGLEYNYKDSLLEIFRQGKLAYKSDNNFRNMSSGIYMTAEQLNSIKKNILWAKVEISVDNSNTLPKSFMLDIPLRPMQPNYPTGCEIVSIQMMLEGIGVKLSAEKIFKKIPVNDDPRKGLRGDPRYALSDPQRRYAYWIYPEALIKPVEALVPGVKGVDLTGVTFEQLLQFMVKNKVGATVYLGRWSEYFQYHNVLVVGFDQDYIYINEPYEEKLISLTHDRFKKLWEGTEEVNKDTIPYFTSRRAFSVIPTANQTKNINYKIIY